MHKKLEDKIRTEISLARREVAEQMDDPTSVPRDGLKSRRYWYGVGRVEALTDVLAWLYDQAIATESKGG